MQDIGEELFFNLDTQNVERTLGIELPTIEDSLKKLKKTLSGSVSGMKVKDTGITFI